MRLFLVLGLLAFCTIAYAGRTKIQKHSEKNEKNDLDEIEKTTKETTADDEDPDDEKNDASDEKNDAPKKTLKKSKKPPKKEERNEYPVCYSDVENGDPCECLDGEMTCDQVVFGDETELNTLMLHPNNKSYVVLNFQARENFFKYLKKGEIIPKMAETVQELDLSKNKIISIEVGAFANFKNLSKLSLKNNKIKKFDPNIFEGAPEETLHQLFLQGNALHELKEGAFAKLKNLKKLVLDDSRAKIVKELFKGLDNLEELSLDNCALDDDVDVNAFDYLKNLKVLSLRGNLFTNVPRAIVALEKLEQLDLSGTHISEVHEKSFDKDQSLKALYMQDMPYLARLNDCAFCDLNNLEELYFENSKQLQQINENAFGNLKGKGAVKSVKRLVLSNCNVTTLGEDLLPWGPNLDLQVEKNSINCTCQTAWMVEEEYYTFNTTNEIPKCAYPEAVKGRVLPGVAQSEICTSVLKKHRGIRLVQSFLILFSAAMICLTFYYLVTSGKIVSWLRTKPRENIMYSNLQPNDEQPLEKDFQPRAQEV